MPVTCKMKKSCQKQLREIYKNVLAALEKLCNHCHSFNDLRNKENFLAKPVTSVPASPSSSKSKHSHKFKFRKKKDFHNPSHKKKRWHFFKNKQFRGTRKNVRLTLYLQEEGSLCKILATLLCIKPGLSDSR